MLFKYKSDKIKRIEDDLEALDNILDSSDKMVNELNNLSDYITTNIEDKTGYLKELLVEAEKKINTIKIQTNSIEQSVQKTSTTKPSILNDDAVKNEEPKAPKKSPRSKKQQPKTEIEVEQVLTKPINSILNAYNNTKNIKKVKEFEEVINDDAHQKLHPQEVKDIKQNLSNKEREIVTLYDEGLDTSEIAKRMGIGRGEIELILSFRK